MFYYHSGLFGLNYLCLNNTKSLQKYTRFNQKDYSQFILRINGIIHGNIISLFSLLFLSGIIDLETWLYCLDFTRGYCLYDMLMILQHMPIDTTMLIHHLMLFSGTYSNFVMIYPEQVAIGLLSELSNQHLHYGWMMIKLNKSDCLLFKINAVFLLGLFLLLRVINFTYLFLFACSNCSYIEPSVILPILSMNYYWFYLLSQKAFKLIK